MPDLEYFLVCRSVAIDVDTDEWTFGGVLEDIIPDEFPYFLDKVVAISTWRVSGPEKELDFQAVLRVFIPGETEGAEFPMNFARGESRYRALQYVVGIPLERPGTLIFEVLLNGIHAASHHVEIHPAIGVEASEAPESAPNS